MVIDYNAIKEAIILKRGTAHNRFCFQSHPNKKVRDNIQYVYHHKFTLELITSTQQVELTEEDLQLFYRILTQDIWHLEPKDIISIYLLDHYTKGPRRTIQLLPTKEIIETTSPDDLLEEYLGAFYQKHKGYQIL